MNKNKYIDHTILKADATKEEVLKVIEEAKEYDFASVCLNPCWVNMAANILQDTDVKVCTVIGFPLGANTSAVKVAETKDAIANGATEIDMVINIGALKSGDEKLVEDEISAIKKACQDITLKVIIETALLSKDEIIKVCELSLNANADFVKTSTGFSTAGATYENVALMKSVVKDELEVKASGGVRTKEDFEIMIKAGATRIGTSNGINLI